MKQTGIWIDHKRAVIQTINEDGENMQKIKSGIEHTHYRGATRPRTPYSAQYQKGDDQLDKQFDGYLNKYYENIFALLRGTDAVLIFGPGEAKLELKKYIEKHRNSNLSIGIEAADKMTDRQIAAKVRHYFEELSIQT